MGDRATEILEATCRVVARHGMHDMRVEDVAAEAGVSSALVYYYFRTRDQLIKRAFEFADGRSTAHTFARMPPGATGAERVEFVLVNEIDDSEAVRENWVIWSETSAAAVFDPELRVAMKSWADNWVRVVADLIRAGQADCSIPGGVVPEQAAEFLTGIVDSIGTRWLLGGMTKRRAHQLIRAAVSNQLTAGVHTGGVA